MSEIKQRPDTLLRWASFATICILAVTVTMAAYECPLMPQKILLSAISIMAYVMVWVSYREFIRPS